MDALNSITDALKERFTNPVYGTLCVLWLFFHWNFVYAIFALDDDMVFAMTGLLKNEYLIERYFNLSDWYFYVSWIAPLLLTFLVIWKFQKWIFLPAYKELQSAETEKKIFSLAEERRIEIEKVSLEQETTKKYEAVAKRAVERKRIEKSDPTILWKEEYKNLRNNRKVFDVLDYIVRSLYEYNGRINVVDQTSLVRDTIFRIPKSVLAYAHSNDLVNLSENKITLTEKGKFFIKEYTQNNKGSVSYG